jgi:hypothetical protein
MKRDKIGAPTSFPMYARIAAGKFRRPNIISNPNIIAAVSKSVPTELRKTKFATLFVRNVMTDLKPHNLPTTPNNSFQR